MNLLTCIQQFFRGSIVREIKDIKNPMPCGHTKFYRSFWASHCCRLDYYCPACNVGMCTNDSWYHIGGYCTRTPISPQWRAWIKHQNELNDPDRRLKESGKF